MSGRRGLSAVLSNGGRKAGTLRRIVRNAHVDPVVQGQPLVSVVLATYNWSSVLRQAIRSVLWQTYAHFELLVVGDACTDDSEQVVASFGDARVRWHNLETNSGSQATPNNVGLERARGEYVAYQGHDDVWHPKHLATTVAHLQRAHGDFGYALAEVLGPRGSRVRYVVGLIRPSDLTKGYWFPPTSIVHRTELPQRIGGWRSWKEADGPPDIDFADRVLESGARLTRVPALTAYKFPSSFRRNVYRDRPSHEQETYIQRIERERYFVERELAALAFRRLSPLKSRSLREEPTPADLADGEAHHAYLRRVRGLD